MNSSRNTIRAKRAKKKPGVEVAPAEGRRERRAAQTRLRLFRSAVKLFARRGVNHVTIEDITEAADVGKGTFFNYFDSKEHVLGVLSEIQQKKVREAAELAQRRNLSVRSVLQKMVLRLSEEPGKNPQMARAFLGAFIANKDVRDMIMGNMRVARKLIANMVALGQQRGEIDRRLKKDLVARQLLQSFLGAVMLWSIEEQPSLRTAAARSFEQFWRGVDAGGRGKR